MKKIFKNRKFFFVTIAIAISVGALAVNGNLGALKSQFLFYTPAPYIPTCVYPMIAAGGTCIPPPTVEVTMAPLECSRGFKIVIQFGVSTCVPETPFVEKDCSNSPAYKKAISENESLKNASMDVTNQKNSVLYETANLKAELSFLEMPSYYYTDGVGPPLPGAPRDPTYEARVKEDNEKKARSALKLSEARAKLKVLESQLPELEKQEKKLHNEWVASWGSSEKVLADCVEQKIKATCSDKKVAAEKAAQTAYEVAITAEQEDFEEATDLLFGIKSDCLGRAENDEGKQTCEQRYNHAYAQLSQRSRDFLNEQLLKRADATKRAESEEKECQKNGNS